MDDIAGQAEKCGADRYSKMIIWNCPLTFLRYCVILISSFFCRLKAEHWNTNWRWENLCRDHARHFVPDIGHDPHICDRIGAEDWERQKFKILDLELFCPADRRYDLKWYAVFFDAFECDLDGGFPDCRTDPFQADGCLTALPDMRQMKMKRGLPLFSAVSFRMLGLLVRFVHVRLYVLKEVFAARILF